MAKLTKAEVNDLVAADAAYWRAKAAFESAKTRRSDLLSKHRSKLPAGEWVTACGKLLRRSSRSTGERFSLGDFKAGGYKVTAAMRKFVSPAGSYDILEVRDAG